MQKNFQKPLAKRAWLAILKRMTNTFTLGETIKINTNGCGFGRYTVGKITEKAILVHTPKDEVASLGIVARYWLPKKGMKLTGEIYQLAHWVKMELW